MEKNLPSSWQLCQVCDLGKVVAGGTPSTKTPEYWGDEIAWISPADLTGYKNKFIDRGAKSISSEGLRKSSAKLMASGSVHFSSRAPIGYTVISSQSLCTNQGFKSLVPANGVFNEYVYYYFKSIKDYAESVATGTTFKELSGKAFSVLPVPLPPLNEQKRIVTKIEELFSELDAGEESFKQARKQLGIYRQSLLKQAFEGKLTEAWRKANPDQLEDPDQLLARIQQERESRHQQQLTDWQQAVEQWEQNGKEGKKPSKPSKPTTSEKLKLKGLKGLPGPWSWCSLQSLLSFGPKNGYSPRAVERTTETKAITLTATTSGTFDNSHFKYLDLFIPEKSELWLKTGDILLQRGNTIEYVGVPALYKGPSNQFTYPDLMMKLQTPKSVSSEFLTLAISDRRARVYMHERASGAAGSMPKINQGVVNSLPIPLCSLPEQQEIVRLLEEQFTVIEQNEREIDAALKRSEALRQSILKRAFSGQLVPQDPTDEPASQLLARIQTERTAAEKSAKVKKKATKKVARKRAKK